jgi:hypothetical protein
MVMGEVSLCRVEELPPTFACELRPALAKSDPAVLSIRVRHESFATACAVTASLVERRCLLVVRGPRLATHRKAVIGALANRFQNVANPLRATQIRQRARCGEIF